jgi:uncharacterized protein (TIGR02145 family)
VYFDNIAQVTDYEGNIYDTVQIVNQVWLKQNIRSKFYVDGIPLTSGYYVYKDSVDLPKVYGYLYTYKAVTRDSVNLPIQGICPKDFHVANSGEWQSLIINSGGAITGPRTYTGGNYLKDSILWNGTNLTGFSLLPGGIKTMLDGFRSFGSEIWLWTADGRSNGAILVFFNNYDAITYYNLQNPSSSHAMYCRCVKNVSTSISEEGHIDKYLKVFPNPSNNIIIINTNIAMQNSQIFIYNSLGASVVNIPFETELNISQLASGLYIMAIKTPDNKKYTAKFIKL